MSFISSLVSSRLVFIASDHPDRFCLIGLKPFVIAKQADSKG